MANITIKNIRESIAEEAVEHITNCRRNDYVRHLIIKSFPGSGKTVSIMKAIDEAHFNWMYFAPFHDIIIENLTFSQLRNYNFIHLKGRKQPGVCLVSQYRELAEKGLNIDPFCRTRCKFKQDGCPYFETRRRIESLPQPWAGVHSHIPTYLQSYLFQTKYKNKLMYDHFDLIIIDEFPFQVLYDQVICNRNDIDKLRDVINQIERDSDEKQFIQQFLDELTLAYGSIRINYTKLKSFLDNHRGLNFDQFLTDYDSTLLSLVSSELIREPPKKILYQIAQIYNKNPSSEKLKWNVHKHKWDGWQPSGLYLTTSNINRFRHLGIPIIALDATAKIEAWNQLLNSNCRSKTIDISYKNIYQLHTSARYPARSWIAREGNTYELSQTGIRLAELIKQICNRKTNSVLLCSNKKVKQVLENYLREHYDRDNYTFANYYNLRSRNSFYEECDTCIITHEPNIPPLQMNIISNITGWDVELLRDLMTTSEVFQAIGRIRQNIKIIPHIREREEIEIYIIPGANNLTKNKLLEEVKLVSYPRMVDGNLMDIQEELKQRIKKLDKSSFKDLWEGCKDFITKKSLKKNLKRLYLDGFITNYRNSIEWDKEQEFERNKTKYKGNI